MGRRKKSIGQIEIVRPIEDVSEKEKGYRLLYDFSYYLENLPRGKYGGVLVLLRTFLAERGLMPKIAEDVSKSDESPKTVEKSKKITKRVVNDPERFDEVYDE